MSDGARFVAPGATVPTGGRRSLTGGVMPGKRGTRFRPPAGGRCRSEDRRSERAGSRLPSGSAGLAEPVEEVGHAPGGEGGRRHCGRRRLAERRPVRA